MPTPFFAEYIWIDGTRPTAKLRSKTKVLTSPEDMHWQGEVIELMPEWSFDGSSTEQAPGDSSDCILKPVFCVEDPLRVGELFQDGGVEWEAPNFLVMCEVFNSDGTPHESNTRAKLRDIVGLPLGADAAEGSAEAEKLNCWFGLEQEYTLFKGRRPLGFPEGGGYPEGQGKYYCGVGADETHGRPLVEEHLVACTRAGLKISGINAEVMPGQWEFQIGPAGPLEVGDHLWLARWLLYRIGEDHDISATLDPKPVKGNWNGAGMHTNFSTPAMRSDPEMKGVVSYDSEGMASIKEFCERASTKRAEHLAAYGHGYEDRLTGDHETASHTEFKWGVSDRTASIRIPLATSQDGYGYLEDRRPNANADPYEVAEVMLKTAYNLWGK